MPRQIFDGIKVADFSWIGVGPVTIKYLADHGATVVHIESNTHPDGLRLGPPFKDRQMGINRSGFFANYNSSKYGVSLNLNHPKGQEVANRLIRWADVVAESFTAGTMARWGLDYNNVRQHNPDVIYYSTCQLGQTGPMAKQPGFGVQLAAYTGFYHISGWPDRDPAGPYGAYTDFINPRFRASAIIAALDYRRRTGKGQHIDLSQMEAGCMFIAPLIMDYFVTGRDEGRQGNRSQMAVPHNAYPCLGEDRWCVIAIHNDDQWKALCQVMGKPEWERDPRFYSFMARKDHEEELDQGISRWTRERAPEQVMEMFQAAGVPAGVVETCEDMFEDPQFNHRGYFVPLEHAEIGLHHYDGVAFQFSRTPGGPRFAAPCLGQHNEYVYREILGMSQEEYEALTKEGVFE